MADPSLVSPGSIGTQLGIGAGGLAAVVGIGYQIWRQLKQDRRDDRGAERREEVADTVWNRIQTLEKRCDSFASERNDLVVKMAHLDAQVAILHGKVESIPELQQHIQQVTSERNLAAAKVFKLESEIGGLNRQMRDLLSKAQSLAEERARLKRALLAARGADPEDQN